jgi:hypothetical protein
MTPRRALTLARIVLCCAGLLQASTDQPTSQTTAGKGAGALLTARSWWPIVQPDSEPTRMYHAVCWEPVAGAIYMYGGTPILRDTSLGLCQRYDPLAHRWATMTPMTIPRRSLKGTYCRGKLYAIGGLSGSSEPLSSCEAYDISSNLWTPVAQLPYSNYAYQAAVWRDSLIYVMGGYRYRNTTDSVWIYNPFTDSWSPGTPLITSCASGDACIIGDTIYFAGGYNEDSGRIDDSLRMGVIDPADPSQITWSSGPALPFKRYNGPAIALEGRVYWFGGRTQSGRATDRGYVYDPATGGIDSIPAYPAPVMRCCIATASESRGEIFSLAGEANDTTPCGYYRFGLPVAADVGVTRLSVPSSDVDSGDTVTPSAQVMNFGTQAQTFQVMLRLDTFYMDVESASAAPGESVLVSFVPWHALLRGRHAAICSTMLAFDSTNQNDVLRKTIMVHAIGAEVVAETLPHDTIVPGTRKLNLSMCNSGTDGTVFWAYLELLRGDTALVYRDSASGFMYPGHQRLFAFDPWNASEGSYLGQYVVRVDDHIIRDTLSWRFWVFGSSACDDAQSWTRREDIALEGPWPNPCRGVATISYALPQAGPVSIKLYDLTGRTVRTLVNAQHKPGRYSLSFGTRTSSFVIPSGVYFIRLTSPGFEKTRKAVITE